MFYLNSARTQNEYSFHCHFDYKQQCNADVFVKACVQTINYCDTCTCGIRVCIVWACIWICRWGERVSCDRTAHVCILRLDLMMRDRRTFRVLHFTKIEIYRIEHVEIEMNLRIYVGEFVYEDDAKCSILFFVDFFFLLLFSLSKPWRYKFSPSQRRVVFVCLPFTARVLYSVDCMNFVFCRPVINYDNIGMGCHSLSLSLSLTRNATIRRLFQFVSSNKRTRYFQIYFTLWPRSPWTRICTKNRTPNAHIHYLSRRGVYTKSNVIFGIGD